MNAGAGIVSLTFHHLHTQDGEERGIGTRSGYGLFRTYRQGEWHSLNTGRIDQVIDFSAPIDRENGIPLDMGRIDLVMDFSAPIDRQ